MKLLLVLLVLASVVALMNGTTRKVCYDQLGCLVTDPTWYTLSRPLNPTPSSREAVNTLFVLHTRSVSGVNISTSDPTAIVSSYDASRPTKFIIHGFTKDGSEPWIVSMISNLLSVGDFNVINVRWGPGAAKPYQQAAVNARVVGLEIAYLINTLTANYGAKAADFHIIGFSLGAQVAGYAGQGVAYLGRITGLDPAGPLFQYTPPHVRLDPTDAQFVDAYHTNGVYTELQIGKGMMQPVGHLDFYANGGLHQPECGNPLPDFNSGCSHNKATAIYNDTLVLPCQPVAYECSSYAAFKQGKCGSCGADNTKCARVGLAAESYPSRTRTNVKLYFDTSSSSPYCKYAYRVTIQLADGNGSRLFVSGLINVNLRGTQGQTSYQVTTTSGGAQLIHGQPFNFLTTAGADLGVIQQVDVDWVYITDLRNPLTYCGPGCNSRLYVSSVEVSSLNNYPESARLANTLKFCPTGGSSVAIDSSSTYAFTSTC